MKKHYVQPGAIGNLVDAVMKLNLSWEDQEELLADIFDYKGVEFVEAPSRTINAYPGRVYIIKASIHGESTLGIGIPCSDELGDAIDYWKYMHIYPYSSPYEVQKIHQITDEEVVDVVAELFGNVGQVRPQSPSKVLTGAEVEWIADNFRVQGV